MIPITKETSYSDYCLEYSFDKIMAFQMKDSGNSALHEIDESRNVCRDLQIERLYI